MEDGQALAVCADMWHENAGLEDIRHWRELAGKGVTCNTFKEAADDNH
jgi:hypothetical protein